MGQPIEQRVLEMTTNELKQSIRDLYQLRIRCHKLISEYNNLFKEIGEDIDCCEKELRKRGHI